MDRARLRTIVLAGVRDIQEQSGRAWQDLQVSSRVVGTLEGFDSINGVEATAVVEQLIIDAGLGTKVNAETIFTDGRRAFTVAEAVDRLAAAITGE